MYGDNHNDNPQTWLDLIEDMLDSGEYDWAEDTLTGIGETIEEKEYITERQKEAITNIQKSLHRDDL